jgi:hypothetical protein
LLDILTCVVISNILMGEIKDYINVLGYKSSTSLKTSRPRGLPL